MLPSKERLSRVDFTEFLASKEQKTVFNRLGTLKYRKKLIFQAAIVISAKTEKRAVYRNKLRRRLYSVFRSYLKENSDSNQYILYVSKQAPTFEFIDLKNLLYELLQKTSK